MSECHTAAYRGLVTVDASNCRFVPIYLDTVLEADLRYFSGGVFWKNGVCWRVQLHWLENESAAAFGNLRLLRVVH